jgi:DNA-binding NtrC family response regulator
MAIEHVGKQLMPPIHLLLVDDEQAFVEALAKRLAHRAFRVGFVFGGEEALRYLQANDSVDVILLDIKMPGLDGLESLQRIVALQPLVEVIMLTAHATVATAVDAMRMGARDYLMKPCDLDDLTAKVQAAARRKRERESKIADVRTRPYITDREKKELIAEIMAS